MTHHNKITTEKRYNERIQLNGYSIKATDFSLFSSPTITDISMEGLRLTKVPRKLAYRESALIITVLGSLLSECHKLTIMPCWRKKNNLYWDVGFYIYKAPAFWKRFVRMQKIQAQRKGLVIRG
jgi:hypothetical protein